jgi:uncharacterized protein (DUF952 family)
MSADFIYHIATTSDWERATTDGEYTTSTKGRTLAQQGFIHCSQEHQVAGVANAIFTGDRDLVLLVIDPTRLKARLQYDDVPGEPEPYPHLYGPLNADAVVEVRPFEP